MQNETAKTVRLHVEVLRDVVADLKKSDPNFSKTFYADVKEAFKVRCARLRIPYDSRAASVALDRLERGGRLSVLDAVPTVKRRRATPEPEHPPLPRVEASRIYQQVVGSTGTKDGWLSVGAIAATAQGSSKRRAS